MNHPHARRFRSLPFLLPLALCLLAAPLTSCSTAPSRTSETSSVALAKPAPGRYLSLASIDPRSFIPDPPAPDSPISNGEIEIILAAQADASPSARARALSEDKLDFWLFAEVLGPSFNPADKPRTRALLKQVEVDCKAASDSFKEIWSRPRPFVQDPRIQIGNLKASEHSYPSGHATRGTAFTEVLCLLAPEQSDPLRARGRLIGFNRIILGVHFPSDVAAGNALGMAIIQQMTQSPAFQQDLAAARAEWP